MRQLTGLTCAECNICRLLFMFVLFIYIYKFIRVIRWNIILLGVENPREWSRKLLYSFTSWPCERSLLEGFEGIQSQRAFLRIVCSRCCWPSWWPKVCRLSCKFHKDRSKWTLRGLSKRNRWFFLEEGLELSSEKIPRYPRSSISWCLASSQKRRRRWKYHECFSRRWVLYNWPCSFQWLAQRRTTCFEPEGWLHRDLQQRIGTFSRSKGQDSDQNSDNS